MSDALGRSGARFCTVRVVCLRHPGVGGVLPRHSSQSQSFQGVKAQKGATTMRNDHVTLRSSAVFDLLAPRTPAVPVQVALRYDTRDPYAIVAAFRTGRAGWVEWVFSRDLLADGLIADAGDGDVRIRPGTSDPEIVVVELKSPSGHAVFEASAQRLAEFLDASYDIVLPGNETLWMNVDDALDQLIANDLP
jgi:hypothetical protein